MTEENEIKDTAVVGAKENSAPKVIQRPKPEKYYRVKFHAKSSPTDSDDVQLAVNGEPIVIERGKEVIIRERFKICADNACFPIFSQSPGHNRKITGEMHVFPYDLISESTEDEYRKMLRDGTRATKEAMKKDTARSDS